MSSETLVEPGVVRTLECFDKTATADCTKALSHNVQHCPQQWHFPSYEQPHRHRRIYMTTFFLFTRNNNKNNLINFLDQSIKF